MFAGGDEHHPTEAIRGGVEEGLYVARKGRRGAAISDDVGVGRAFAEAGHHTTLPAVVRPPVED